MRTNQIELELPKNQNCRSKEARRLRRQRSQWWFEQMRQAVERAVDWKEQGKAGVTQMNLAPANFSAQKAN
jgi:hypothetical protein